jgi:hypothetical protein
LVLREGTTEQDVAAFAEATNARKVKETTASPELGLTREVTWEIVSENYLHFGTEHPSGSSFVQVSGDDDEEVEARTAILREYYEPLTDDELLAALDAADTLDERRVALIRVGLGAPRTADDRFFTVIVNAMRDQSVRVREAGLWAATYALWPELLPLVEEMETTDSYAGLRAQAHALAEYMRAGGRTP